MLDRFEEKAKQILDHKDHYKLNGDEQVFEPSYQKLFRQISIALQEVSFGGIDELSKMEIL